MLTTVDDCGRLKLVETVEDWKNVMEGGRLWETGEDNGRLLKNVEKC